MILATNLFARTNGNRDLYSFTLIPIFILTKSLGNRSYCGINSHAYRLALNLLKMKQETIINVATSPSWSIMKANHHAHWHLTTTASGDEHIVVLGVRRDGLIWGAWCWYGRARHWCWCGRVRLICDWCWCGWVRMTCCGRLTLTLMSLLRFGCCVRSFELISYDPQQRFLER